MNIDLRKEFETLMHDYGHWVVLRHALPGRRCSCISKITKEALSGCTKCLGSGRAYTDTFVKARKSRPIKFTHAVGGEALTGPVQGTTPEYIYYLRFETRPSQDDYVLEIGLTPADRDPVIPCLVTAVYNITDVREMRMDSGRVEYYALSTERQIFPDFEAGS